MSGKVGRPVKVRPYPRHEPPASTLMKAAFAKFLGVEAHVVSDWLARGCLALALLPDGRLDVSVALEALEAAGILSQDMESPEPPLGVPDGTLSTDDADRLDANLKAHQRMLEVKRRRGELIERAPAERLFFEAGRASRDSWGGWPPRVAAVMAAELGVEPAKMLAVLEREVRQQLASIPPPQIAWGSGASG